MTLLLDADGIKTKFNAVKGAVKFPDESLQQFIDFISNAPEEELFRASPLRYAAQQNTDHLTAANLFLMATHAGIFKFSWGTLCPSCGMFLSTGTGLRHIHLESRCALCTLPHVPNTDSAIEIAFTISPEVRPIRFHDPKEVDMKEDWMHLAFSSSIALFPEVHQILHSSFQDCFGIPANHTEEIELDLEQDHYLFIVPANHAVAHISVQPQYSEQMIKLEIVDDGRLIAEMTQVAPGKTTIQIKNQNSHEVIVGLHKNQNMAPTPLEERPNPIPPLYETTPYLTGKQLITNQTFRNLFPKESIPADEGLEFEDITFLFTDLKGSTELYDRVGDTKAYKLILQHFDALRDVIAQNSGAVVKTMGDAIMASFADPVNAAVAACAMKTKMSTLEGSDDLELKVGIHTGPTMAINTNEQLDFFGQTVNIASRVQHAAGPGEIVITQAVYDAPGVQETIENTDLEMLEEQEVFKGVSDEITIYRLT